MNPLPNDASEDQTGNIPSGYYRRNTGMLHMMPAAQEIPPAKGLTEAEIEAISGDKDKMRLMATSELIRIISKNNGDIKGVTACNVLLDRVDGKPQQSVDVSGKVSIVSLVLGSYQKEQIPLVDVTPSKIET